MYFSFFAWAFRRLAESPNCKYACGIPCGVELLNCRNLVLQHLTPNCICETYRAIRLWEVQLDLQQPCLHSNSLKPFVAILVYIQSTNTRPLFQKRKHEQMPVHVQYAISSGRD